MGAGVQKEFCFTIIPKPEFALDSMNEWEPYVPKPQGLISSSFTWATLLSSDAHVAGHWCEAKGGERFEVMDPGWGRTLGSVANCGSHEAEAAILGAHKAFQTWSKTTAKGKPLFEARIEVAYAAGFLQWFAEEGRRAYGHVIPAPRSDCLMLAVPQPLGVAALITPWNFPAAMITRKAGAALAAGCTVVIKPAEDTPFTALALARVLASVEKERKGDLTERETERTELGSRASRREGRRGDDGASDGPCSHQRLDTFADPLARARHLNLGLVWRKGQTCICTLDLERNQLRPIVDFTRGQSARRPRVVRKECGAAILPRDAFELGLESVDIRVERHVKDALEHGANVVCGGKRHSLGGSFYHPTVLANVTPTMACATEEIFGPLAAVTTFDTEEEVLTIANSSPFGLAGYIYSCDLPQIVRVVQGLDVGIVGVNEVAISAVEAPFGGVKESGVGREGSFHGLHEYMDIKYVCYGGLQN
uniref:Aldehyde dehydrogenase 5 family member A1 n=1 Tax=Eptatretus burgeri TaxID=7764 RepID=A0A8C4X2A1_EPTBU